MHTPSASFKLCIRYRETTIPGIVIFFQYERVQGLTTHHAIMIRGATHPLHEH